MKQILLKMAPDVANILMTTIGIGYVEEPDKLVEGSGFTFNRWLDDPDLAEYWVSCDESIYEAAINELLANGLTITFPPEPEPESEFELIKLGEVI